MHNYKLIVEERVVWLMWTKIFYIEHECSEQINVMYLTLHKEENDQEYQ